MYKYKFTCVDKEDFLYKCMIAGVRDGEITKSRLDEWFSNTNRPEDNLIGADCVWTVDTNGRLACFGETYANNYLRHVKDITICEINLGGL